MPSFSHLFSSSSSEEQSAAVISSNSLFNSCSSFSYSSRVLVHSGCVREMKAPSPPRHPSPLPCASQVCLLAVQQWGMCYAGTQFVIVGLWRSLLTGAVSVSPKVSWRCSRQSTSTSYRLLGMEKPTIDDNLRCNVLIVCSVPPPSSAALGV